MFRFLHAADIHLDSPLRGLVRRGEGASPFVEASRRALENLITIAIDRRVAFLIIAGDVYDGDWRDYATGQFFIRQMGRLEREGIAVFLIRGNHDAESVITKALPLPATVRSLSVRSVESVVLEKFGVAVHGRGFASRHVDENVSLSYPPAVPGLFNIGVLHTSLTGRDGHGVYAPCSIDDLKRAGYQYWALGHIHRREVVCKDPFVVFPGNLQGRHAKESGAKGATLVTVEDGRVTALEALTCDAARFDTREAGLSGVSGDAGLWQGVRAVAAAALADAEGRPLALRLRLSGNTDLHHRLVSNPDGLREEVQSIAWALSDQIFIEKVEIATAPLPAPEHISPFPEFQEAVAAAAADPVLLASLSATIDDLRSKLPAEALALLEGGAGPVDDHVAQAMAIAMRRIAAELGHGETP